jgi:hypothetical protein
MKRFRITYLSKAGGQVVTLMARNKAEAEVLANTYQTTRAARYDITHQRMYESLEAGTITKEQFANEAERRKVDFSRYDIVTGGEVGAADAPLKLANIEEVK